MFERDFDSFVELLDGTISLNPNWKPLQPVGKALFFRAMEPYSYEQVSAALTAHIRDTKAGMFQPTPAHLIAQIQGMAGNDGRPGAEEAWAIALTSRDESDTVIWTQEVAEAFAICAPVLATGDEVGARMAFKEAYQRLVVAARAGGVRAFWRPSLGWDMRKREAALTKATAAGLLAAPTVAALLPQPVDAPPADANARSQLDKIRKMMADMAVERERDAELHAQRERNATTDAKRRANEQVAQYKNEDAA